MSGRGSTLFRTLAVALAVCAVLVFGSAARAAEPAAAPAPGQVAGRPDMAAVIKRLEERKAKRRDEIDAKIAELNIKPRTVETWSEKGVGIRNMLKRGDFAAARQALADVVAGGELTPWAYRPFSSVLEQIPAASDPVLEQRVGEWVARSLMDPLPLIVRADLYLKIAWSKRGEKTADRTSAKQWQGFGAYWAKALADIDAAIKLDPDNPYSYVLKLKIISAEGFSEPLAAAFADAIGKFPDYLTLYQTTLAALEPKWGGSVKAMYRFVDSYAGKAPADSPLKLLYLYLYAHLLDDAAFSCFGRNSDEDKVKSCIAIYMDANVTADLKKQIAATLKLYDRLDHLDFGSRVREALTEMIDIAGARAYSSAMLEQAAEAMHSDTELDPKQARPSDYIIDELVAERYRDAPGIAINKLKQALRDIDKTMFAHAVDKDQEESFIYDKIAGLYNQSRDPSVDQHCPDGNFWICGAINAIAYETAAKALNKTTQHDSLICTNYQVLMLYKEAIKSCTDAIDYDDNIEAHSMRGQSYTMLHQWEPALRDLTIVADSDSEQRIFAQMGIVMVYLAQSDYRSAVKTLNNYPALFDPDIVGTSFVFTSFNNRCLAYSKIGELQKALNDCTEALKYNWAQTTYQLQQELQQKLGKR